MHDEPLNRPIGRDPESPNVDPSVNDPSTAQPASADQAAQDLKATADSIRIDIGRLATIEDEKLVLDAEDPRVDQLSDEAVRLADRIRSETRAERQLSAEIG